MHSWFSLIQDKFNAPYFIDTEIDEFLNAGQEAFINDIYWNELQPSLFSQETGKQVLTPIESTSKGTEIFSPLFVEDIPVTSDANGLISNSAIETALNTAVGDTGHEHMFTVLLLKSDPSLGVRKCRFVRHNDYGRFKDNVLKAASERNPIYRINRKGILVDPAGVSNFLITVIKKPIKLSIVNSVDCELPTPVHRDIVAYAAELAGIASRDQILMQGFPTALQGNGIPGTRPGSAPRQ